MADLSKIKKANRIEELVEEAGWTLDRKPGERYCICLQDPTLKVDIEKQRYFWDAQDEEGDVINWLARRNEWPIQKAIAYLKNRPNIPADQRPHFPAREVPATQEEQNAQFAPAEPVPVEYDHRLDRDRRVADIKRLAMDYPGGVERLLASSWLRMIEERRLIPSLFVELAGEVEQASGYCCHCGKSLAGWQDGGVYLAVQVDGDYSFANGPRVESGIYCQGCVHNFKRWTRALDLLAAVMIHWQREEQPVECGAAAGGITDP